MTVPREDEPEHDHQRPSPSPAVPAGAPGDAGEDGAGPEQLTDARNAWDRVDGVDETVPLPHDDQERRAPAGVPDGIIDDEDWGGLRGSNP